MNCAPGKTFIQKGTKNKLQEPYSQWMQILSFVSAPPSQFTSAANLEEISKCLLDRFLRSGHCLLKSHETNTCAKD